MGYYTRFELKAEPAKSPSSPKQRLEAFESIAKLRGQDDGAAYAISSDGGSEESCKWYDHEIVLRNFSKQHSEVLYTLSGKGEESGDIWRKYFLNGKMQVAKANITFEDYNPKKLK